MHELEHCPRKFMYLYKLGLHPREYVSSLSLGRVFHLVLQALFSGESRDKALQAANKTLNKMSNEVLASADPAGFTPSGKMVTSVLQTMEDDFHKARAMAVAFMDFVPFNWEEWEILETPDGLPCIELKLEAKVCGISVPLVSPCDLALVKKSTGDVWIIDHKTTSMKTMARARSVRISSQIALYRLVLQCHLDAWAESSPEYPHYRVMGSIHNIVRKPTIKYCPKTKDKEGFNHYIERIHEWYRDEHAKDEKNSPILQTATAFTSPTLSKELYLRLQQTARACRANSNLERFFRAGDYACQTFNSECPFSGLCSSDPITWEEEVNRRFEIKFREDEEDEETRDYN